VHFGFLVGCILLTLGMLVPDKVRATCGRQCDASYSTDIDNCHLQYGDDPADVGDLTNCVQEAKDDYRRCLDDCNSAAISLPRWHNLVARSPRSSSLAGPDRMSQHFINHSKLNVGSASAMGDISNGQFATLGFVDDSGCGRVQPWAHLSHSRGNQPLSVAARF
jgi:hypothetical protein